MRRSAGLRRDSTSTATPSRTRFVSAATYGITCSGCGIGTEPMGDSLTQSASYPRRSAIVLLQ